MGTVYGMVKEKLISIIKKMSTSSRLFVRNPGKDFTRNRKLSFETVLHLLLGMGGASLQAELLEYSEFALDTVTSSAFIQQRDKLLPSALEYMLHQFIASFPNMRRYKGYKLLALGVRGIFCVSEFRPGEVGWRETWRHMTAALAAV